MHARFAVRLVAALVLSGGRAVDARAQETIFNVPSPDVLERGLLYLETDQYFRSWKSASDRAALFLVRGVFGVGHNVEVRFNSGAFDYLHASQPFLDASVKWRPLSYGRDRRSRRRQRRHRSQRRHVRRFSEPRVHLRIRHRA